MEEIRVGEEILFPSLQFVGACIRDETKHMHLVADRSELASRGFV